MTRRRSPNHNRGTTLLEVVVAIGLLVIIFLFVTLDLIQSSQAEGVTATHTTEISAANYLMDVIRTDPASEFWLKDWGVGPNGGSVDPCGNNWAPYSDSITAPDWHPAPACTPNGSNPGLFPQYAGMPSDSSGFPGFSYMWNVQQQGTDPNLAQLTVWVRFNEDGRPSVYELESTRANEVAQSANTPVVPTPAQSAATPCQVNCGSPSQPPSHPPVSPTPKPSHSPTPKPSVSPTPKPTPKPSPSGFFE
jgi:hypothetical protein